MSEEGWANLLMMAADCVKSDLTPEQAEKNEAVIQTARALTQQWKELMSKFADDGPPTDHPKQDQTPSLCSQLSGYFSNIQLGLHLKR